MARLSAAARAQRTDLLEAIAGAVVEGKREAGALHDRLDQSVASLQRAGDALAAWQATDTDAVAAFRNFAENASRDLADLFERQAASLDTFNIAFFGRTGTGKSTLLSAFGELDGSLVSRGESDWTTDIHAIDWHGSNLIDTPGIEGWGRTEARGTLEERARRAVEISDVVILSFDDQAQQDAEFRKMAAWVRDYGKPVIAVLNVRNARWRQPALVTQPEQRRLLSQTEREHVMHIEESLERIELPGTPVVVINSRRALDALARTPFKGPDKEGFDHRRRHYGRNDLLAWSNFPLLDEILTATITVGASDLRTAALRDGLRSSLQGWQDDLKRIRAAARASSKSVEKAIESVFAVLGAPHRTEKRLLHADGVDLFKAAEKARRRPYAAPTHGELHTHAARLFAVHLAPLRTRALADAEELVWTSFRRHRDVSAKKFAEKVFDTRKIDAATQRVYTEAVHFAQEKIRLTATDAQADIKFTAAAPNIAGAAGRIEKYAGTSLRIGGVLAGAAGAMGVFALANIWNPLGWSAGAAAAISAIGAIASLAFGWIGSLLGGRGESRHTRERSKAIAAARRSVNDAFDDLGESLSAAIADEAWTQAAPHLRDLLHAAIGLQMIQTEATRSTDKLGKVRRSIAGSPDPVRILDAAIGRVAASRGHTGTRGALLRGEDWIGDITNHPAPAASPADHAMPVGLNLSDRIWDGPTRRQASDWERAIAKCATQWPTLGPIAAATRTVLDRQRPLIAFAGDYSAGKSSLIKRLLLDAGTPIPPALRINAAPATDTVQVFEWDRYDLVDMPGFHSGNETHDALALDAIAPAFLVIAVMHNNGIRGEMPFLDSILFGTPTIPAKGDRTVFLINRSDSLTTDPTESPKEFRRIRQHKADELRRALASRGHAVDPAHVWCVASDPFGLIGDGDTVDPTHYDQFRAWDGIEQMVAPLRGAAADHVARAVNITAVESGLHGLMGRLVEVQAHRTQARNQQDVLASLIRTVDEARTVADALEKTLTVEAERICRRNANAVLADTLEATTNRQVRNEGKRLSRWWKDDAFIADTDHYEKRAKRDIDRWLTQYSAALGRQLFGNVFAHAYPTMSETFDTGFGGSVPLKGAADTFGVAGTFAQRLTRDAVYASGKFAKVKFRPYQAIKTTAKVNKFGGYLAAAGVVLDVAVLANDLHDAHRREEARKRARAFVNTSVPTIADQIAGTSNGNGPVGYLRGGTALLASIEESLRTEQVALNAQINVLSSEADEISRLLAKGHALLGRASPTEVQDDN